MSRTDRAHSSTCPTQGDRSCWEYPRTEAGGYGRTKISGRTFKTHRISAAVNLGLDLRDTETDVCHHCDNPPCCNPKHLFLGDDKVNVADAIAKGRRSRLAPNSISRAHCGEGHDKLGRSQCPECKRLYDVERRRVTSADIAQLLKENAALTETLEEVRDALTTFTDHAHRVEDAMDVLERRMGADWLNGRGDSDG